MDVALRDDYNRQSKPLDIAMARKLEDYKSSIAEPYWKRVAREPPRGVATNMARVKNKAAALGKDFQVLLQAHERQEKVAVDLRDKVKQLRHDAETKEKQVALAYRTIERLAVDKNNLEATCAEDKTYIRKLESRLVAMKGITELEAHCNDQHSELQNVRVQLLAAEERAVAAEERAAQQLMDLTFMRRGIELAAEQLTRTSGATVSSSMLLAVAQGQEEALSLHTQLTQLQAHTGQLTAALEAAKDHLQAQHDALLQWQQADAALRGQVADLEAALQNECAVSGRLRREADKLRPAATAAVAARDGARNELELERTKRVEAEGLVDRLLKAGKAKETEVAVLRAQLQRMAAGMGVSLSPGPPPRRTPNKVVTPVNASRNRQQPIVPGPAFGRATQPAAGLPARKPQNAQRGKLPSPPQHRQPRQHQEQNVNRSSLDDHIAMLEGQLADLSSAAAVKHLQDTARAAAAGASASSADPSPVRSSKLSSPERVPHRYTTQAGGEPAPQVWHTNPLADSPTGSATQQPPLAQHNGGRSEDGESIGGDDDVTTMDVVAPQQQQRGVGLSTLTLNEDRQWDMLEAQLDQAKSLDHRLNTMWQPQAGVGGVDHSLAGAPGARDGGVEAAPSRAPDVENVPRDGRTTMQSSSATSCTARTTQMPTGAGRRPAKLDVSSALPSGDAFQSPALSAALRGTLPEGGADWLDGGFEPDIEQLEVKSGRKGAKPRQTLFDLANMELEY